MKFFSMREIKFRAWDLKTKSFYKPTYRALEGKLHDISITLDGIVMERTLEHCASMLNNDNYILMQYTGLKDKNGKEIYEGDYVKWTHGKHYWEAIIQTVPNNKSNTLYAIETYHNCTSSEDETVYTFQRSDSRKGSRNDIEYISSNIEVIGNIYENPELLNND